MKAKESKSATVIPFNSKRIAWSRLRDFFEGQWVELVDYKWDWNQPTPSSSRVRHHASDRATLLNQIRQAGTVPGSVILFIGNTHSTFEHSLSAAV